MSYAMQPPAPAPAPIDAPRRPASVSSASILLILMAVGGLVYAVATLVIAPGTVDRFRAAAGGANSVDVEGFITVVWIGAALSAVLAVILFALYVVLALGLRRGSNAARIATWVIAGLGLLGGCASTVTVAIERSGDPAQGSLSAALSDAYPGSWIPLNVSLAIAQMLGYVLVGILLLASPGTFFGRAPKPLPPDPFAAPGQGGYPAAPGQAVPGSYPAVPGPGGYPATQGQAVPGGYPAAPGQAVPGGYPAAPGQAVPGGYSAAPGQYPAAGFPGAPGGYSGAPSGYPGVPGGYPGAPGAYPPPSAQGGYSPAPGQDAQGGYVPGQESQGAQSGYAPGQESHGAPSAYAPAPGQDAQGAPGGYPTGSDQSAPGAYPAGYGPPPTSGYAAPPMGGYGAPYPTPGSPPATPEGATPAGPPPVHPDDEYWSRPSS